MKPVPPEGSLGIMYSFCENKYMPGITVVQQIYQIKYRKKELLKKAQNIVNVAGSVCSWTVVESASYRLKQNSTFKHGYCKF